MKSICSQDRPTCKAISDHWSDWTLGYKELRQIRSRKKNIENLNIKIVMKRYKIFKEKDIYIYRLLKSMLKQSFQIYQQ